MKGTGAHVARRQHSQDLRRRFVMQQHASPCETPGIAASPIGMSPLTSLSLRDENVVIGPILPDDTGALFLWLNDVESAKLDLPYRPLDWMNYNAWLAEFGKNQSQTLFAVRRIRDPRIIGFVGILKIHPVHRSAEIGLRIGHPADRGQGLGRAALKLALTYAWQHLNLGRVQLNVFESNRRAIRAYEAAGFVCEGRLRRAAFINGAYEDVMVMAALNPNTP
jgi:RimJ/RimL family protein N-acetyltransferase